MNRFDLEERLISYAVEIIVVADNTSNKRAGLHLSGQLIRSGTSVALNYGEALSGESKKDFVHKMKISLKELRESFICLRLIKRARLINEKCDIDKIIDETNQLISIFVKSIKTAEKVV